MNCYSYYSWYIWSFWWIYFVIVVGILLCLTIIITCIVVCIRRKRRFQQDTIIVTNDVGPSYYYPNNMNTSNYCYYVDYGYEMNTAYKTGQVAIGQPVYLANQNTPLAYKQDNIYL
jgi:hypothetical protein